MWYLWLLIFWVTMIEMGRCCYLAGQAYSVPVWCYSGGWWELAGARGVDFPVADPEQDTGKKDTLPVWSH